jgi:hypothetical protein
MKQLIIVPTLLLALATACGAGTLIPLETTPRTPAAIGTINVEHGPNNNTVGKLHVEHLAPPAALRGDLNVYVAWVRPVGAGAWQNVGQLMVGESREGTLRLKVAQQQFELLVSAEGSGDATKPSEFVVMQGQVDSRNAS